MEKLFTRKNEGDTSICGKICVHMSVPVCVYFSVDCLISIVFSLCFKKLRSHIAHSQLSTTIKFFSRIPFNCLHCYWVYINQHVIVIVSFSSSCFCILFLFVLLSFIISSYRSMFSKNISAYRKTSLQCDTYWKKWFKMEFSRKKIQRKQVNNNGLLNG